MKNLIKINLKQKIALPAAAILLFILCGPLTQLVAYENSKVYLNGEMLVSTMEDFFMPDMVLNLFPAIIMGVTAAVIFFGYVFSKKRVDLYHSIPVNRKKLFAANYVTGIIVYYVGMLPALIISIVIAAVNHYLTLKVLGNIVMTLFVNTVHFLYIYSATVFVIMLTGNMIVALLGTGVVTMFVPALCALIENLQSDMFVTYSQCTSVKEPAIVRFAALSPVVSFVNMAERFNDWDENAYLSAGEAFSDLIAPIIVTLIILAAAYVLYLKRPSEAAGKALAFKISRAVIEIPIVIMGGLIGGWFMNTSVTGFRTEWIWIGVVIGVVLIHCILEIIFNESFKALFSHKIQLVTTLGVTALFVALIWADLTQYDKFIPNRDNIKSASVNFEGIDQNLSYVTLQEDSETISGYSFYYRGCKTYSLMHSFTEDVIIDKIYGLSQIGVTCVDDMVAKRYESDTNDIVYYDKAYAVEDIGYLADTVADENSEYEAEINEPTDDEKYAEAYAWMQDNGVVESEFEETDRMVEYDICYELKNGNKVLRHYSVPLSKVTDAINEVYKTDEYNRAHFDIYEALDKDIIFETNVFDSYEDRVMTFTGDDNSRFLDAYIKDLKNVNINVISKLPLGRIVPNIKSSDYYNDSYSGYYIYEEFTNTLDFLKSKGADLSGFTIALDVNRVNSIGVCSYDLYKYEETDNTLYTEEIIYDSVNDAEKIENLIPQLINKNNLWSNELLINKYENGNGAELSAYLISDKGMQRAVPVMFKSGKLSEEVKKDIAVGVYESNNY